MYGVKVLPVNRHFSHLSKMNSVSDNANLQWKQNCCLTWVISITTAEINPCIHAELRVLTILTLAVISDFHFLVLEIENLDLKMFMLFLGLFLRC